MLFPPSFAAPQQALAPRKISFDGDATDDTFKDAGRVGLWTKADSVIQFDDFGIDGE